MNEPRDASLVRELPGTGSKTCAHGASGKTEVADFMAASQPIADKSAYALRAEARYVCGPGDASLVCDCRSGLVRELPGTGSKTCAHGASGKTEVADFKAASQPIADKSAC
ncbi:hypothetical protein, partial [Pseudomonas syringae group genomosp. 3]|uniref:hypothetical protein n=1 Tax=Pseudomonas syringae group genomosp. 3 TaxID=251701 RepID=UPI001C7FC643